MKCYFLGYTGSIQTSEASNTSLAIEVGREILLIDVSGSPFMSLKQSGLDPLNVQTILLTHTHIDHLYALPSFIHQSWLVGRRDPLQIIGNEETIFFAQRLCDLFNLKEKKNIFEIQWTQANSSTPRGLIEGVEATLFDVPHGVPTLGITLKHNTRKLVYFADCKPLESYDPSTYDADLLIHECGGTLEEETNLNASGHSSAHQAGEVAKYLRSNRLLLVHLPEDVKKRERCLTVAKRVFLKCELPQLYTAYEV